MSLILALVIVLVVGGLIANYYPTPNTKIEPITPEPEPVQIEEPVIIAESKEEVKDVIKPKKKPATKKPKVTKPKNKE